MPGVLIKGEHGHRGTDPWRRTPREDTGREWRDACTSQGGPGIASHRQELEEAGFFPRTSLELSEEAQPRQCLDFWPPELGEKIFSQCPDIPSVSWSPHRLSSAPRRTPLTSALLIAFVSKGGRVPWGLRVAVRLSSSDLRQSGRTPGSLAPVGEPLKLSEAPSLVCEAGGVTGPTLEDPREGHTIGLDTQHTATHSMLDGKRP